MGGIQWTNLAEDLNSGWLWHFCCSNWVESSHGENCKDANFGQFPHLLQFNWEVNKIIFLYFVIASWSVGSKVQPWIKYRCKLSHIPSCPTGQNNVIQCTDFFIPIEIFWKLIKTLIGKMELGEVELIETASQAHHWVEGIGALFTNPAMVFWNVTVHDKLTATNNW